MLRLSIKILRLRQITLNQFEGTNEHYLNQAGMKAIALYVTYRHLVQVPIVITSTAMKLPIVCSEF